MVFSIFLIGFLFIEPLFLLIFTTLLLLQLLARSGDGYKHSHRNADHPFTKKEKFAGVTVKRAVEVNKKISFY